MRMKITPHAFLAWGDFHVRSCFARSTIPEEKWGLLVVWEYQKLGSNNGLIIVPGIVNR